MILQTNPVQYKCQANNILLISDGESTTDENRTVNDFVSNNPGFRDPSDNQYTSGGVAADSTVSPIYFGSKNLDDLAWYAHNKNIYDPTLAVTDTKDIISTYVVYTGVPCGSYTDSTHTNCTTTDESVPEKLMQETARNGGTTYQRAEDPTTLYTALNQAFQTISARAASGTAASVLATGEGSGANLVQAIFYPKTTIGGTQVQWIGSLKNLWYYIDPLLASSSIREDTDQDKALELTDDYIAVFYFDTVNNLTKANLYADSNGDGVADSSTPTSTVYFEDVKNLWEASSLLRARSATDRKIFTTTNGSSMMEFTTSNKTTLRPYLQEPTDPLASRLISYVSGDDSKFCSVTATTTCTTSNDCPSGETCTQYRNRTVTIGGTQLYIETGRHCRFDSENSIRGCS